MMHYTVEVLVVGKRGRRDWRVLHTFASASEAVKCMVDLDNLFRRHYLVACKTRVGGKLWLEDGTVEDEGEKVRESLEGGVESGSSGTITPEVGRDCNA